MSPNRTTSRFLTLAVGFMLLAGVACRTGVSACSACGRQACANLTTTVSWQGGGQDRTCCPRCALHLMAARRETAAVSVRDFDTAATLAAEDALFVEGSDVHSCRGLRTIPPRDPHGCCLSPAYDRCEPSLLAFTDAAAARSFMARHGGVLTDWPTLVGDREPPASPASSSP